MARKQVVVATGKSVAGWDSRVKAAAEKQVASVGFLGGGSRWISFKGGVIMVDGATAPAGKFNCVVLGYMQTRTFFENEYDGAKPQSPDCYAYGDDLGREAQAPHEASLAPQADACASCEWSKYGSAEKGRGQRCRQHVRLALVPATEEGVLGEPYFAHVPPTSIKNVKGWLTALNTTPCFAAVTEIKVQPSAGNMFDVLLNPIEPLPVAFQSGVIALLDRSLEQMREPYPDLEEEEPPKPAAKKKRAARKF